MNVKLLIMLMTINVTLYSMEEENVGSVMQSPIGESFEKLKDNIQLFIVIAKKDMALKKGENPVMAILGQLVTEFKEKHHEDEQYSEAIEVLKDAIYLKTPKSLQYIREEKEKKNRYYRQGYVSGISCSIMFASLGLGASNYTSGDTFFNSCIKKGICGCVALLSYLYMRSNSAYYYKNQRRIASIKNRQKDFKSCDSELRKVLEIPEDWSMSDED